MEGRTVKIETKRKRAMDSYLAMIRRFPLRPIRNEAECDEATVILDKYIVRDDLDEGKADYLQVLVGLVGDYEDKHHPVDKSHITPLGMLKHLMEANDMQAADLGRLLGNSGLASMILHGKRAISKANAKILGKRFGLNPGVFI
jgi:HTH-type transcriptional regulator / antitoxin HigA